MSYNFDSGLPEALGQLLKMEKDYNVIIHIGEKPNFKEFHAHSVILHVRSEYFNKVLSAENIEKENGNYLIKLPNISPKAFEDILKYLYTDQVNIANKTGAELLDFMIVSDKFMLKKLTKLTEDFVIKNHLQFLQNDPVGILQIIYYCKPLVNLQELCLDEVCSKPEILFNSGKFTQISAPLLEIILKRDDLSLNEIEIWENLIKWGLAQGQALNKDVTKWNQDDINTFKRILYKFIPLIRFYDISTKDYFNKVKPYEEILSKELRDDILKFYMIPEYIPTYTPRHPKCDIDSIIISREHIPLFASWIDGKERKNIRNIPYEFKLLYRDSRDGNTAATFHAKCDNKGANIVVVKIKNKNQIIGGYNPLEWNSSNTYKATYDSFIFSFTNKNDLQSAKVGYSNGNQYSIVFSSYNGPFFGGNDIYINYNNNNVILIRQWLNANTSTYPKLDLPDNINYEIDDYEVFQVIKK
ncbi:hypothetical protein C1645_813929 [Glomus cerebriforme]|uniref:BTB/POZ domain-containing protein n=1 Tax=Glomus cerebriforme TaxID=658196 RepID=A0A397THW7_9GLOM|nr:hypothetical protein C1645_813929 [Glomus cerebriforme]